MTSPHNEFSENHASQQPRISPPAPGDGRGNHDGKRYGAPALATALVYLVFGLITVFWQQPHLHGVTIACGVFMLALGLANAFFATRVKFDDVPAAQSLNSIAMMLGGAAVLLVLLSGNTFFFTLITAVALGIASVLKLVLGMRTKEKLAIGKDWQLEGLIMTITAVALVVTSGIGDKAMLGTIGGGAIITGVFLLLGALALGADEKKNAAHPTNELR